MRKECCAWSVFEGTKVKCRRWAFKTFNTCEIHTSPEDWREYLAGARLG